MMPHTRGPLWVDTVKRSRSKNTKRAQRAQSALAHYKGSLLEEEAGPVCTDTLRDFLTDLLHLHHQDDAMPALREALVDAVANYEAESGRACEPLVELVDGVCSYAHLFQGGVPILVHELREDDGSTDKDTAAVRTMFLGLPCYGRSQVVQVAPDLVEQARAAIAQPAPNTDEEEADNA